MNDKQRRKIDTLSRLDDFGLAHASDFADNSTGKQLFTEISNLAARLNDFATSQVSGRAQAQQGTTTRAVAREDLRTDLEAIGRTARALSHDIPGILDQFRTPPNVGDQELLAAARAFAEHAAPLSARFIAFELPASFLEDLNEDIRALETAMSNQANGRGEHVAARAEMSEGLEAMDIVRRQLDAIVKNKYVNNPGVLAEWATASHTVRDPRRRQPAETPAPVAAGQASTNPA